MRIGHELLNKSELARQIGITPDTLNGKIRKRGQHEFDPETEEKLKNIYIELFENLFEISTVEEFDAIIQEFRNYLNY